MTLEVFFKYTGSSEIPCVLSELKQGDIFRVQGKPGYWRCTSDPYLNEQVWQVDAEAQQFLVEG